jgi:acetolactate synthase-1/2/3 large subunit
VARTHPNEGLIALMGTIKLSDYVGRFIRDLGVRHVFVVPGGGAMHLNDSIGHTPGIQCVYNLHEQASAIAAEAYARVTGGFGAALVTSGPGSTNAITGVLAAWLDSTPCLFISGQVKRADLKPGPQLRQLGPQEVDICALVRPITKYAVTVRDATDIRARLETAVLLARTGRPGPVWIDIPLDIQAAAIDPARLAGAGDSWMDLEPSIATLLSPTALADAASAVASALRSSERPVLLAGNGIRIAGAVERFQALARRTGIPVLTTRLGVDLLPTADPLCFGAPGTLASRAANFTLQNCDFLLVLGARLDLNLLAHDPGGLARGATKVMVNIDAAELERLASTMDISICADARTFIEALATALGPDPLERPAWLGKCRAWRVRYPFVTDASTSLARATGALSMYRFAEVLSQELADNDVILPGSSGSACEVFLTAMQVKPGQRVFHNKGTGAMGFGVPASVGASLASGGRRVVCVDGDGGFQFNVQELETIKRLRLPIKFFVVNNSGYASIRQSQSHHFGRLTGADDSSDLTLPHIGRVARAYGLSTFRIASPRAVRATVRRALAADGPVVCEVVVAPDEERMPRVQSMVRSDGSVVSKPLEDMWPYLDRDEFMENMIVPPVAP